MKEKLHPRNKHRSSYDFKALIAICPALSPFVNLNAHQKASIDFSNPKAVKLLNKALLFHHYQVQYWDIPANYLCPPIPGRADYLHHIADLVASTNAGKIPKGAAFRCLDIGVGANCVYPIIGHQSYGWSFVGTDIDPVAINAAQAIIDGNPFLKNKLELRLQTHSQQIFQGIIPPSAYFDLSICNPPFHASLAEAQSGTARKLKHTNPKQKSKLTLNFAGQQHELFCEGGEKQFIQTMIKESKQFATNCFWFSSLVSKEKHLKAIYQMLKQAKANLVKTIPMGQGNKVSRIVAWSFLDSKQQKAWAKLRWQNLK